MKSKLFLSLLVLSIAALSCKKEYTCNCTTTDGAVPVSNKSVAYGKKMTKKQAQAACDHEATAVQSNLVSFAKSLSLVIDTVVDVSGLSTSCTLK